MSVVNGAAQGAAMGSTFGPYGMAIGAGLGAIGGFMSGKSKKKAAKSRMKKMQQALKMFQAGSTDAFGNTLSANKDGRWNYNLSNTGKAARDSASRAINAMNNYQNKSSRDLYAQDLSSLINSNNSIANANQAAAMKSALRQGSNVGYISNAYNQAKSKNIANAMKSAMNSANNSLKYNTNMRNMLANAAQNSMIPINSMQGNLQNMVNSLNATEMNQMNQIAGAASNPYLHGQATADLLKGVGQGIGDLSIHFNNNAKYNQLMKILAAKYGAN